MALFQSKIFLKEMLFFQLLDLIEFWLQAIEQHRY